MSREVPNNPIIIVVEPDVSKHHFWQQQLKNTEGVTIVCSTIEQTVSTLKMLIPQPPQYPLTKREKEVMQLLKKGHLYKEIAQKIGISMGSLKQYIHIIYEHLLTWCPIAENKCSGLPFDLKPRVFCK